MARLECSRSIDRRPCGASGGGTATKRPGGLEALISEGPAGGFLARLPQRAAEALLGEAVRLDLPPGAVIYRDDEAPRVIVVIAGVLRLFMGDPDGRQVTVLYAHPGDVLGLALTLGGPAPISIQAVSTTSVVALRVDSLRAMVAADPVVARTCAEELSRELYRAFDEVAANAFRTVHQRVARHLLDLATPDEGKLVARVSQQEVADAVGSVREVVARALHDLREMGLIETSRDKIIVLDPLRLSEEASGRL
jgi:CRP/FNR family transcriptional regulator